MCEGAPKDCPVLTPHDRPHFRCQRMMQVLCLCRVLCLSCMSQKCEQLCQFEACFGAGVPGVLTNAVWHQHAQGGQQQHTN
jgi:hypothetical protein